MHFVRRNHCDRKGFELPEICWHSKLCYAAANMVLDPQELQYFDTAMFVVLLIGTMSQSLLLFALVSLSVPGSYTPDPSFSLSKTNYLVIKRCMT